MAMDQSGYKTGNKGMDQKIAAALLRDGDNYHVVSTHDVSTGVKENKYNVSEKSERTYKGIEFDSKHEMQQYQLLELLEKAHEIENLQIQVHFNLLQGFTHAQHGRINPIDYVADFVYRSCNGAYKGKMVVVDAKGVRTPHYKDKRKWFLKLYPEYIFLEV